MAEAICNIVYGAQRITGEMAEGQGARRVV